MKRITFLVLLAMAATASAATDGTYTQGNTKKGAGVRMLVVSNTFAIKVIRFREKCTYGSDTFHDYFKFFSGTKAHLTGKVNADGTFSGKYVSQSGKLKVSGTINSPEATIKATEGGPYIFGSTKLPNHCKGSHTFLANLATT